MEKYAISVLIVMAWAVMLMITTADAFDEGEEPGFGRKPFDWKVDDRLLELISTQVLRRYKYLLVPARRRVRIRPPPVGRTDSDGCQRGAGTNREGSLGSGTINYRSIEKLAKQKYSFESLDAKVRAFYLVELQG